MTVLNEMNNAALELECAVIRNAPLCEYTSFKIGGPTDLLIKPDTVKKAASLLNQCKLLDIPYFILGRGSNLVVSDAGFRGVVICTSELDSCEHKGDGVVECGVGVKLSSLCKFVCKEGLSGLEFAYGIPGSVGGAVYMNAGAYNGEMKDVLLECDHIDTSLNVGTFEKQQLELGYRNSVYKTNGYYITSARMQLSYGNKKIVEEKMNRFMNSRKEKQPLDLPSAGSVFKRPEGNYAGALIEMCKLKGYSVGRAKVSEKHAGFIVNTGQATAEDVKKLIRFIQDTVFKKTGIALETEIEFL